MSTGTLEQLLTSLAVPLDQTMTQVVDLHVTLPVEVSLHPGDLLIGAPQWRWRTDFDADPSRLCVRITKDVMAS